MRTLRDRKYTWCKSHTKVSPRLSPRGAPQGAARPLLDRATPAEVLALSGRGPAAHMRTPVVPASLWGPRCSDGPPGGLARCPLLRHALRVRCIEHAGTRRTAGEWRLSASDTAKTCSLFPYQMPEAAQSHHSETERISTESAEEAGACREHGPTSKAEQRR